MIRQKRFFARRQALPVTHLRRLSKEGAVEAFSQESTVPNRLRIGREGIESVDARWMCSCESASQARNTVLRRLHRLAEAVTNMRVR